MTEAILVIVKTLLGISGTESDAILTQFIQNTQTTLAWDIGKSSLDSLSDPQKEAAKQAVSERVVAQYKQEKRIDPEVASKSIGDVKVSFRENKQFQGKSFYDSFVKKMTKKKKFIQIS